MKTCEQYLSAIGEMVDGTLGPLRRAELDLHLENCDRCRALADDLQRITQAAQSLDALQPPDRVWTQIAGRLQEEGRIRPAKPWPIARGHAVLALAAALVLAIGASLVFLVSGNGVPRGSQPEATVPEAAGVAPDDPAQSVASELALTERHFQNAIEQATQSDVLVNAEMAAVLQKNLLVVNQAIAESRAALDANPESTPARQSLYDALRQKIQFLQDTVALMNVMRQGDAAGAAELVEGRKS